MPEISDDALIHELIEDERLERAARSAALAANHMVPMNHHTPVSAWITFWFKCLFGFTVASLIYSVIWAAIGFGLTMFLAMLGAMLAGGAVQ